MVSTRQNPREFPSTPSSDAPKETADGSSRPWAHTPSATVTIWLLISVPVVLWDTGYVLLRPHSMPGGKLHSPIWTPYALYGAVDYIYGWPAFNARNGFTAAQGILNLIESAGYIFYLFVVNRYRVVAGRPSQKKARKDFLWFSMAGNVVEGRIGAYALLIVYTASVATLSKTVMYLLNEAFSGFENVRHNDAGTLLAYWILPNGFWIVFPSYMVYVFGWEILSGLESATPRVRGSRTKAL